jgi:hypothetical protein
VQWPVNSNPVNSNPANNSPPSNSQRPDGRFGERHDLQQRRRRMFRNAIAVAVTLLLTGLLCADPPTPSIPPAPAAPTLASVTITLSDGSTQTLAAGSGITPDQFKTMTGQQLIDWLSKKPPALLPAKGTRVPTVEDFDKRLRAIEEALARLLKQSTALPAEPPSATTAPPPFAPVKMAHALLRRPKDPALQRIYDETVRLERERPAAEKGAEEIKPIRPPQKTEEATPETYAQAYLRALAEDKPLLVWVGGNFCPD